MTAAFDGQVALVTGAGGGIGLATAAAFAGAGAAVILADRDAGLVGTATESLRNAGHRVTGVTCDVTDSAQVDAVIERTVRTYGRLDVAFNNAGVNSPAAAFLETSDDEFERVMAVNLRGVWNCMKGELRAMLPQGHGAIVNCASIGGLKGSRGRSAYSASKHAVIGLTRCGLSWFRQHTDGGRGHQQLRSGHRAPDGGAGTDRTLRRAGRNRRRRAVALQFGGELHGGSCADGGRRHPRGLTGSALPTARG